MDRYLEPEQGPLAKLYILQHFCLLHYVCVPNAQHILCDGICDKCVVESSRGRVKVGLLSTACTHQNNCCNEQRPRRVIAAT